MQPYRNDQLARPLSLIVSASSGTMTSFLFSDIASGLFIAMLIAYGSAHALGWFMLIATLIPIADAVIVLHEGGSRTVAFSVHGGTAVAMLIISGLLLIN